MQIIKSKYSSKDLFELYKKEEAKVDKKAKSVMDTIIWDYRAIIFSLTLITAFIGFAVIYGLRYANGGAPVPLVANICVVVELMLFVLMFLKGPAKKWFQKHCDKQGKILDFSLNGYYWMICFIEDGEEIASFLENNPEALCLFEEGQRGQSDIMTLYIKNDTGLLKEHDSYRFDNIDSAYKNFGVQDGVFDFSIYDERLESAINKIVN